jgi:hypothetical protein
VKKSESRVVARRLNFHLPKGINCMATEKQIAANQANAKLSHGPVTEAGRIAAELNAFRHGLAVKTHEHFGMLYDEKQEVFDELLSNLNKDHAPTNETESLLVRHMAQHEWLRARALRLQADCVQHGVKSVEADKFALFMRYQTTHERAFHASLNQLQSLRKQERNMEIGIESQRLKQAAEIRAVESQNLRREQFEFKKEVYQARKVAVKAPVVPSGGLKMAA